MCHFLLLQTIGGSYQQGALYIFLVMLACIQAFFFFVAADAQGYDEIDEFEDEEGYREAINHCNGHGFQLDEEEGGITISPAVSAGAVHGLGSEDTRHQHTSHTADAMAGEHIQCVIQHCPGSLDMNSYIGDEGAKHA